MSEKDFVLDRIKRRFRFLILSGSSAEGLDDFERVYRLAFEHALKIVDQCENSFEK